MIVISLNGNKCLRVPFKQEEHELHSKIINWLNPNLRDLLHNDWSIRYVTSESFLCRKNTRIGYIDNLYGGRTSRDEAKNFAWTFVHGLEGVKLNRVNINSTVGRHINANRWYILSSPYCSQHRNNTRIVGGCCLRSLPFSVARPSPEYPPPRPHGSRCQTRPARNTRARRFHVEAGQMKISPVPKPTLLWLRPTTFSFHRWKLRGRGSAIYTRISNGARAGMDRRATTRALRVFNTR